MDIYRMIRVLIIDDDESFVKSLIANFRNEYKIFTAESGEAGITIIKNERIDACLLNLRLPDMDGIEVLRRIKEIQPDPPVIYITAYADLELQSQVENGKYRAQFFVSKPPNINFLKEMVGVCVSGKIREEEKKIVKFSKGQGKKKKDVEESWPKSLRQAEILRLLREEPDKWNPGKLSIKFGCSSRQIQRDFQELNAYGINIERTKNGCSIIE